jgi:hypothetical protein
MGVPGRYSSAEEAEAKAYIAGVYLLIQLQCTSATMETDCRRTVQVLVNGEPDKSASWPLYLEGQELLKVHQSITVTKVDRLCNRVAHGLAQLGKSGESGLLHGSIPISLEELVSTECMLGFVA